MVITSPPYWGLRDFKLEPVSWPDGWNGQLGLEPTFDLYVEHLCDVFDEVKRVLKKEGTCWVNIGDTYTNDGKREMSARIGSGIQAHQRALNESYKESTTSRNSRYYRNIGLSQKSLCLVPFRFAVEMVSRGWILRSVIIWHKPNAMPSSAKDRFTVDFEYLLLFTKSRRYYFETQYEAHQNRPSGNIERRIYSEGENNRLNNHRGESIPWEPDPLGRNKRCVWTIPTRPFPEAHFAVYPEALVRTPVRAGCPEFVCRKCRKAREPIRRTVQTVNHWDDSYWWDFLHGNSHTNRFYKEAFSIMKEWMTLNSNFDYGAFYDWWLSRMKGKWKSGNLEVGQANKLKGMLRFPRPESRLPSDISGWSDCGCNAGWESGIVLDPFMGSGTTGVVALKEGRTFIGIELNPEYVKMAQKRLRDTRLRPDLSPGCRSAWNASAAKRAKARSG